jgi:hypothetical protein
VPWPRGGFVRKRRRYGSLVSYGSEAGADPVPRLPEPDLAGEAVAAGAVAIESDEEGFWVRFMDRKDTSRISGGDEVLDIAYEKARSMVTAETSSLGIGCTEDGKLGMTTVGSTEGVTQDSFEVRMGGPDIRRWVADRLGVTEWRRLSPTVEISA